MGGIVKTWFENGQPNGTLYQWYEDGKVEGEVTYINGVRDGLTKVFYPNGNLKYEEVYSNGVLIESYHSDWYIGIYDWISGWWKD